MLRREKKPNTIIMPECRLKALKISRKSLELAESLNFQRQPSLIFLPLVSFAVRDLRDIENVIYDALTLYTQSIIFNNII